LGHLIEDRAFGPSGFAHHMLQRLMVSRWNDLFYAFHVLGFRLDQSLNILLSRRLDRPRPLAEMPSEAITKVQEPLTHPGQQSHFRRGGRVFLRRPRMSLSYATL